MTFSIKGYEPDGTEAKATHIDAWYDPHLRLWTLTQRDDEGNQVGAAVYEYGKANAMRRKAEMEQELGKEA